MEAYVAVLIAFLSLSSYAGVSIAKIITAEPITHSSLVSISGHDATSLISSTVDVHGPSKTYISTGYILSTTSPLLNGTSNTTFESAFRQDKENMSTTSAFNFSSYELSPTRNTTARPISKVMQVSVHDHNSSNTPTDVLSETTITTTNSFPTKSYSSDVTNSVFHQSSFSATKEDVTTTSASDLFSDTLSFTNNAISTSDAITHQISQLSKDFVGDLVTNFNNSNSSDDVLPIVQMTSRDNFFTLSHPSNATSSISVESSFTQTEVDFPTTLLLNLFPNGSDFLSNAISISDVTVSPIFQLKDEFFDDSVNNFTNSNSSADLPSEIPITTSDRYPTSSYLSSITSNISADFLFRQTDEDTSSSSPPGYHSNEVPIGNSSTIGVMANHHSSPIVFGGNARIGENPSPSADLLSKIQPTSSYSHQTTSHLFNMVNSSSVESTQSFDTEPKNTQEVMDVSSTSNLKTVISSTPSQYVTTLSWFCRMFGISCKSVTSLEKVESHASMSSSRPSSQFKSDLNTFAATIHSNTVSTKILTTPSSKRPTLPIPSSSNKSISVSHGEEQSSGAMHPSLAASYTVSRNNTGVTLLANTSAQISTIVDTNTISNRLTSTAGGQHLPADTAIVASTDVSFLTSEVFSSTVNVSLKNLPFVNSVLSNSSSLRLDAESDNVTGMSDSVLDHYSIGVMTSTAELFPTTSTKPSSEEMINTLSEDLPYQYEEELLQTEDMLLTSQHVTTDVILKEFDSALTDANQSTEVGVGTTFTSMHQSLFSDALHPTVLKEANQTNSSSVSSTSIGQNTDKNSNFAVTHSLNTVVNRTNFGELSIPNKSSTAKQDQSRSRVLKNTTELHSTWNRSFRSTVLPQTTLITLIDKSRQTKPTLIKTTKTVLSAPTVSVSVSERLPAYKSSLPDDPEKSTIPALDDVTKLRSSRNQTVLSSTSPQTTLTALIGKSRRTKPTLIGTTKTDQSAPTISVSVSERLPVYKSSLLDDPEWSTIQALDDVTELRSTWEQSTFSSVLPQTTLATLMDKVRRTKPTLIRTTEAEKSTPTITVRASDERPPVAKLSMPDAPVKSASYPVLIITLLVVFVVSTVIVGLGIRRYKRSRRSFNINRLHIDGEGNVQRI